MTPYTKRRIAWFVGIIVGVILYFLGIKWAMHNDYAAYALWAICGGWLAYILWGAAGYLARK